MATSIAASFDEMRQRMEITDLQATTVSTRQQSIRDAVANGLTVVDSFLTGSYARSTMIAPLNQTDVDIFVVLNSGYFAQYTPSSLLTVVRDVLLRTYKTPQISANGQAVTLTFSDFAVDVVPSYNRMHGGYLIPEPSSNGWISTDPRLQANLITQQNRIHAGLLIPLVKMVKAWNRTNNTPFVPLYLELLVVSLFVNRGISDYPGALAHVFEQGRGAIRYQIADPAGYGSINGLRNASSVDEGVALFSQAYETVMRAIPLARGFYATDAINEWRTLFGNYFPAYG